MKAGKLRNASIVILLATQLLAQSNPGMEMQEAIKKEQVDGDLKAAIAIYQRVAADTSAPRDLRARALLHQGRCYEKLGQQAQTVYGQIVRDFGDQPEAVQAKARLAVLKAADRPIAPKGMTQRKIESPGAVSMNPGETDGRSAVYLNSAGELIYGDIAGKSKRVIFKAKSGDLERWFPSRDFSTVLLVLHASKRHERRTLAIVNTGGTGYREIAKLDFPGYEYDGFIRPVSWSWDNRYILCVQPQGSGSRLLRISVADGQISELQTLKARAATAAFSPDGRFVAYQEDAAQKIFILALNGGEPQLAYEEQQAWQASSYSQSLKLLDWTADGRYLAIASERTGKGALHLLPTRDGKSAGAPVFVKYGNIEGAMTMTSGGLVYRAVKPGGVWAVYFASLDANGRPDHWKRLDLSLGNLSNPWPQSSGDSNLIVYVAKSQDVGQTGDQVVHLRSLSTGEDREIYRSLGRVTCVWAFQEPKLFCSDTREKTEILSIAASSGEKTVRHTFPVPRRIWIICSSRDDQAIYMDERIGGSGQELILRLEISAGQETVLEKVPAGSWVLVSADGRWLIRWAEQNLAIRPTSGGEWKSLVSLGLSESTGHFNVTPDGNWLLYHDIDSKGRHSLFRVATAGGTAERLGDFPTDSGSGTLGISADGSKIIVSAGDFATGYELWSLENFVPPAPKR